MMGINKLPEASMHWDTSGLWYSCFISSTMSRNQFEAIGNPRRDKKLARIEAISDIINRKSQLFYKPRTELSIDESMIAYKGRHGLKLV